MLYFNGNQNLLLKSTTVPPPSCDADALLSLQLEIGTAIIREACIFVMAGGATIVSVNCYITY